MTSRGSPCGHLLVLSLLLSATLSSGAATASNSVSRKKDGTLVLYLLLKELGYTTRRISVVPRPSEAGIDLMVALHEGDPLRVKQVVRWATNGGRRLLFAPPLVHAGGYCDDFVFGEQKIERVMVARHGKSLVHARDGALKLRPAACQMKAPPGAKVLVGACGTALALELTVGDGKALLLAHADLLVNSKINEDDLIVVVRRWLQHRLPPPATVAFLEQKQAGQFWEMLRKANMLPLVLHGLLWLLVLYWVVTPRFGESSARMKRSRREFAQHAKALGHLYLASNSSRYALQRQYERFVGRLFGSGGDGGRRRATDPQQRPQRSRKDLASLVATRTGRDPKSIEQLLAWIEDGGAANTDAKATQEHYRLSQALAELQRGSARPGGKKRGWSTIR